MDERDIIRLVIHANKGKIRGRTAIQKIIYLSCKLIKELKLPNYTAHYYGPYSSDVAYALRDLVAYNFVKETSNQDGNYITYEYELTNDGRAIVETETLKKYQNEYDEIKKIIEKCNEYCNDGLDINELSYATKIYHVVENEGSDITLKKVLEKAKDYNWKINPDGASRGVELLRSLKLVE